jgi:protein TonB
VHTHRLPIPLSPPPADAAARRLPPLRDCSSGAGLAPSQRRVVVLAIIALHVLALWALLQVQAVRDQAVQIVPILVDLLAPPAPPTPPAPPRPPEPVPQPVIKRQPPPKPRPLPPVPVLSTPEPASAESFAVPPPPPAPAEPAPPAAPVAAPPPAPAVAAPPPRVLPDTAVQYLVPPQVEYPRLSQKRGETGQVLVRAYISTGGGAPQSVEVERSSGHARLDQAALAAVHKARFKPYAEAGRPVEGWALIPIRFELEK